VNIEVHPSTLDGNLSTEHPKQPPCAGNAVNEGGLTVKLSRRLIETSLWTSTAAGTNLIRKMALIQPVGWSTMLGRPAKDGRSSWVIVPNHGSTWHDHFLGACHIDTGHKVPNRIAIGFRSTIFIKAGNHKSCFGYPA
jgi:hypothetical protein